MDNVLKREWPIGGLAPAQTNFRENLIKTDFVAKQVWFIPGKLSHYLVTFKLFESILRSVCPFVHWLCLPCLCKCIIFRLQVWRSNLWWFKHSSGSANPSSHLLHISLASTFCPLLYYSPLFLLLFGKHNRSVYVCLTLSSLRPSVQMSWAFVAAHVAQIFLSPLVQKNIFSNSFSLSLSLSLSHTHTHTHTHFCPFPTTVWLKKQLILMVPSIHSVLLVTTTYLSTNGSGLAVLGITN